MRQPFPSITHEAKEGWQFDDVPGLRQRLWRESNRPCCPRVRMHVRRRGCVFGEKEDKRFHRRQRGSNSHGFNARGDDTHRLDSLASLCVSNDKQNSNSASTTMDGMLCIEVCHDWVKAVHGLQPHAKEPGNVLQQEAVFSVRQPFPTITHEAKEGRSLTTSLG